MKKTFYLFAIALIMMTIACNKDKTVSINGFWTGSGLDDGSSTPIPLSILYSGSNTAVAYILSADTSIALKVNGTYSIDADSVRTTISTASATTLFVGKLNSSNNAMNGTFRSLTNSSRGTWSVTKN